jgi:fimbrial isopeptide formation D2 family protein
MAAIRLNTENIIKKGERDKGCCPAQSNMMIRKRILGATAGLLAAMMMATPVIAAAPVTSMSTINPNQKGSITIYKKVENDGKMTKGVDGLEKEDSRDALKGIEFTALKIADLETKAYSNQAGLYYTKLLPGFSSLAQNLGVTVRNAGKADVYKAEDIETALYEMDHKPGDGSTYTGETRINDLVKNNGTKFNLTDAQGKTTMTSLNQGLYLIAETDNSKSSSTVAAPAVPFLVSVPMTNLSTIGNAAAGTAWQYDVTVYPKNSTIGVTKKIVADNGNDLIDTDDTQIGNIVHQVIIADAPLLLDEQTYKEFIIHDTMSEGLTFQKVTRVAYGIAVESNKLNSYSGYTNLVNETDYKVKAGSGNHSFDVTLTASALAKLDKATKGSMVVVEFDAELNSKAEVGPNASKNENHPTVTWRNSNTLEKQVEGPKVKVFTYEIDLKKEGLTLPQNAVFTVTQGNAAVSFAKETDGVYHVFSGDDNSSAKVERISPSSQGTLKIKGLDSKTYTFKEVGTQNGYNLLRSTFDVRLTADNPVNGNLVKAELIVEGETIDIQAAGGIASLAVVNSKTVTLKTGGVGNTLLYAVGVAILMCAFAFGLLTRNDGRKSYKDRTARMGV